jgi:AcrR family transcriptional regulator
MLSGMTPRAPAMAPDDRRASIIAATIPLLRDKGRGISTREIAKAAGIAEGTIFRVFESKDEIILACVHEAFDTTKLRAELATIDTALPLPERLTAAVIVMQEHLQGIFALMSVLQSSGQPLHRPIGADALRRRQQGTAELDQAFTDLIGDDVDLLRIPVRTFIGYLRMLTLSSVHPMLDGQDSTAAELVDVVLEGALARPGYPPASPAATASAPARPATASHSSRGKK